MNNAQRYLIQIRKTLKIKAIIPTTKANKSRKNKADDVVSNNVGMSIIFVLSPIYTFNPFMSSSLSNFVNSLLNLTINLLFGKSYEEPDGV